MGCKSASMNGCSCIVLCTVWYDDNNYRVLTAKLENLTMRSSAWFLLLCLYHGRGFSGNKLGVIGYHNMFYCCIFRRSILLCVKGNGNYHQGFSLREGGGHSTMEVITTSSREILWARIVLLCISLPWNWSPQMAACEWGLPREEWGAFGRLLGQGLLWQPGCE